MPLREGIKRQHRSPVFPGLSSSPVACIGQAMPVKLAAQVLIPPSFRLLRHTLSGYLACSPNPFPCCWMLRSTGCGDLPEQCPFLLFFFCTCPPSEQGGTP